MEDIVVENYTFGDAHATLILGSECIHGNNIVMRNCVVNNSCRLLKFKMRGDTYQIYENVTVENITGKCGQIIDLNPWTQFFDLAGSTEKPFGIIRNITMQNIKVQCDIFGEMGGNPPDKVSTILFKNIDATAKTPGFKNKYQDITAENVVINGVPLVIQ